LLLQLWFPPIEYEQTRVYVLPCTVVYILTTFFALVYCLDFQLLDINAQYTVQLYLALFSADLTSLVFRLTSALTSAVGNYYDVVFLLLSIFEVRINLKSRPPYPF
jgi:hypothetical protein